MERLAAPVSDPKEALKSFEETIEQKIGRVEADLPELQRIQSTRTYWPLDTALWDDKQRADNKFANNKKFDLHSILTFYYEWLVRKDAKLLFLGILQTYKLSPKLRKNVEACAKFYSRARINRPKTDKLIDDYIKLMALLRAQLKVAKEAIHTGVLQSEGGDEASTELRAGSFTIINMGGFDPDVVKTSSETMVAAEALFRKAGLGKVCYGDANISNQVSSANTLAFYQVASDAMFLFPMHKKSKNFLRTVCHELGHRLQFKFLSGSDREIGYLYRSIANKEESQVRSVKDPEPGEKFEENGKVYVVESTRWGRKNKEVILHAEVNPKAQFAIDVKTFARLKNRMTGGPSFVTSYAAKNEHENFAEMIAEHVMGTLSPALTEMLLPILK